VILPLVAALLLPSPAQLPVPTYAAVRAGIEASTNRASKKKSGKTTRTPSKTPVRGVSRVATASAPLSGSAIRSTVPHGALSLATDLGMILDRAQRSGEWGVVVVSLSEGDTLFDRNADRQLLPASTMKLFTSAMAFDRFGANGRFETEVLRAGAIGSDGTLRGDLVLRGAGDPTLAGKSLGTGEEPPMRALARQVAAMGIKRVSGNVLADASAFEDRRVPDGWRSRYLGASYAARVSALSFNENKITVVVRPVGGRAVISFEPAVTGVPIENEVKVVAGKSGRIGVRQDSTGRFAVVGTIGAGSAPREYGYVVEAPEMFAAGAFRAALSDVGVTVDGPVKVATAPTGAVRVASLASPTLDRIITQMNGESNNHFAELLFRNSARSTGVAGSAENGNVLLRRFLYEKMQVPPTSVFAADGSGLSTLDRVTPRAMVRLLGYAKTAPWGDVFEQSLPVAGRTETLRKRMKFTAAMGNLHAKTGTTNDVASLGGYVTARNGERLAFSFIYNGTDRWRAKDAMDAMGVTLASFSR
jgi:D-alanyl-D-alanine carboxypeptidase/D-alanyl-D-alanine-endopeptidase (penicillin-binding protein 4)